MREEYDYSKGVRGTFYKPDSQLNLPVYLDSEFLDFVRQVAIKRKQDISTVVNSHIKK